MKFGYIDISAYFDKPLISIIRHYRHIYKVIFRIESTYIDKFDYKTNYLQILICMKSIPIVFIAIPLLLNIVIISIYNLRFNILSNWSIFRYAYKYVV